tara:strand:- start:1447 stop:1653 length:207 start_codon:yes stop_codon:yes gene_type:complete
MPSLPSVPTVAAANNIVEGSWTAVAIAAGSVTVAVLSSLDVDAGIVGAVGVFITASARWIGLHLLPHG